MEKRHRKRHARQQGMNVVVEIYRATTMLPPEEKYGLTSQMRRSAVSIVSNIAEGAARQSSTDYAHFLSISLGSVSELDTQLEVCGRLELIPPQIVQPLRQSLDDVGRMLVGLRKSMRRRADEECKKRRPPDLDS